ncbi:flagellar motor switch phosphatase FliY [Oceanotoga teriensis]|jgi:flagellar motor switch protein FliN/FliY|uniref:Flagellar motor switch protein FliN/FliY n=1 Tax=Oceanotoga teriensis TaxID=515440 RepID=A0AA45C8W9_9BACT|nr:flagellar motor switch phosphatase FliY [Oceanotoga teriensis]MDO7975423.1 flagellar motor switch phosphatase FliY [Oceanotoga teriensis]PWJ96289.1 flagellar motor switch protein FliN/FliY [Oceanotoga teriensis]
MLGDDFLSQEELDSLLQGLNEEENGDNKDSNVDIDSTVDMMGEIGNIAMGSGSTTLSTLLRKKVNIGSPESDIVKFKDIKTNFQDQQLVIIINYKKGLEGLNTFVLPAKMALIISNLMMGGDGNVEENAELDEISKSAVGEAMNQMMGSASTAMSEFLKTSVDITPPEIKILDFSSPDTVFPPLNTSEDEDIISIRFNMEIEGLTKTIFWQFIPLKFAKVVQDLMKKVMEEENKDSEVKPQNNINQNEPTHTPEIPNTRQQTQQVSQQPVQQQAPQPTQQYQYIPDDTNYSNPNIIQQGSEVTVNPVNFGEIDGNPPSMRSGEKVDLSKLQLLLDVPLEIKVELGRVNMSLREVLDLHQGSMIQLDKLAGEPLDIYANGKLIARGEVVVIEESFGIRITEIVSLKERLRTIK